LSQDSKRQQNKRTRSTRKAQLLLL